MNSRRNIFGLVFITVFSAFLFVGYIAQGNAGETPLFDAIFSRGYLETAAENLVAAIYLNYRLFDTLLEALLLLVSVIAVAQFSALSSDENIHPNQNKMVVPRSSLSSRIITGSLTPVYMLIAFFGVYVTITGMDGAGGGFQGGAILAAIIISANFAEGKMLIPMRLATLLEKGIYALIIAVGSLFILSSANFSFTEHRIFLFIINVLIGMKVCFGLSLIYLHFISASEDKHEF